MCCQAALSSQRGPQASASQEGPCTQAGTEWRFSHLWHPRFSLDCGAQPSARSCCAEESRFCHRSGRSEAQAPWKAGPVGASDTTVTLGSEPSLLVCK